MQINATSLVTTLAGASILAIVRFLWKADAKATEALAASEGAATASASADAVQNERIASITRRLEDLKAADEKHAEKLDAVKDDIHQILMLIRRE